MPGLIFLIVVGLMIFPHVIGIKRGITIGRSAVTSHRQSVRIGARLGRWQMLGGLLFLLFLRSQI